MTPDQIDQFNRMQEQIERTHRFWFESEVPNTPTRAEQLDKLLFISKWSGFSGKALLALLGLLVTLATAWTALKSFANGGG